MGNPQEPKNNEFLITFVDLKNIIHHNKSKIWLGAFIFASLFVLFSLSRPVEYQAEATFKEKGKSNAGIAGNMLNLLLSADQKDSEALAIMKSRQLAETMVKQIGYQVEMIDKDKTLVDRGVNRLRNNLLTEYALTLKLEEPIITHSPNDLLSENVSYEKEVPLYLNLKVTGPNQYTLLTEDQKLLGQGFFGKPFVAKDFSLTLLNPYSKNLNGKTFNLTIYSLGNSAERLLENFDIEMNSDEQGLINIKYKNPDRHLAAAHLNVLMDTYKDYIQCEYDHLCDVQSSYLLERQKTMGEQLRNLMKAHADHLTQDAFATGFLNSQSSMDFIASTQETMKQKLSDIEFEIERLQNINLHEKGDYEKLIFLQNLPIYLENLPMTADLAVQMNTLQQEADALTLALKNDPKNKEDFQLSFATQWQELSDINEYTHNTHTILASLARNELPFINPKFKEDPKFIIKMWSDKLLESASSLSPGSQQSIYGWSAVKLGFSSYLSNLLHYFDVYQRNLKEQIAQQQTPILEFQGINLETSKELYISYSTDLHLVQSSKQQKQFTIHQFEDPTFEISSLSLVFQDVNSLNMVKEANDIIISLNDHENRSSREIERLKIELATQKKSLLAHLQQTVKQLELEENSLKEKIQNLNKITLALSLEKIYILEKQLEKSLEIAINSLKDQKEILKKKLYELRLQVATLPQKWAAEQVIVQQMEMNKKMLEEISKMVEGKIISNNLEKIQSAPLDLPLTPLHPLSPKLLLFTLLGATFGAFLTLSWVILQSSKKGITASQNNLEASGYHVSGSLSRKRFAAKQPLSDNDLNTLRHLITFMNLPYTGQVGKQGHAVLLLKNHGPDYVYSLAELIARKGKKVLLLDLCFDKQEGKHPGILQYLEKSTTTLHIAQHPFYDLVTSGGESRYANELMSSDLFREILQKLSLDYDWIIAFSDKSPQSAEVESLFKQFSTVALTLRGESVQQLNRSLQKNTYADLKISFILTDESAK